MIAFNAGDERQITINADQIADFEAEFAEMGGSFLKDFASYALFRLKSPILREV